MTEHRCACCKELIITATRKVNGKMLCEMCVDSMVNNHDFLDELEFDELERRGVF